MLISYLDFPCLLVQVLDVAPWKRIGTNGMFINKYVQCVDFLFIIPEMSLAYTVESR